MYLNWHLAYNLYLCLKWTLVCVSTFVNSCYWNLSGKMKNFVTCNYILCDHFAVFFFFCFLLQVKVSQWIVLLYSMPYTHIQYWHITIETQQKNCVLWRYQRLCMNKRCSYLVWFFVMKFYKCGIKTQLMDYYRKK